MSNQVNDVIREDIYNEVLSMEVGEFHTMIAKNFGVESTEYTMVCQVVNAMAEKKWDEYPDGT